MNDALVLILSRNAFYKRLHYLALGLFGLSLLVLFTLLFMLYFLVRHPVKPLYFPTDKISRLIEVVPVSRPNMSYNDVVNWTIQGVQAAYSFDYLNYRSQMQNAQKYFTSYGWTTYVRALRLSGNLSAVTDAKRIAMARVVEAPKLLAEGLLGGSYAWKFQMPVLVTYFEPPYTDQTSFASAIKVTVLVQRQPPLQGYQGLGIMQFIAEMP